MEKETEIEKERKKRTKFLFKLADAGFGSEKAIERLGIADLQKIPKFIIADIEQILLLQKALREKNLIEYLTGEGESTCSDE